MSTLPADPLTGTDRLLVDGNNLLHALSKASTAAPRSTLIGRIRGVAPASVTIDVVFDGPATPGLRHERIAAGLRVRYSGQRTADAVLLALVDEARREVGPLGTAAILVVTDDRDLRHALRGLGARTAGAKWLLGRLDRPAKGPRPTPGPRPAKASPPTKASRPSPVAATDADPDGDDAPRWEPGRGATVKKGNPRRTARRRTG